MNLHDLYNGAGRLCNIVAENEELTGNDLAIAKECLSLLLASWSQNPALQWSRQVLSLPTDGSSAIVTLPTRPVAIHQAQWNYGGNVDSGVKWNLEAITETEYYRISYRNITAPPSKYFWDHNLSVTLFPTPSVGTLVLMVQMPLIQDVNDLTTQLSMPPGYELALKYSLAVLLCDEYGKNPGSLEEKAANLVGLIQVQSHRPELIRSNAGQAFGRGSGWNYIPLINR